MSVAGVGLALLAFAYAAFLIFFKVFHGQSIQGWTTTMVVLAFLSGVQLLCLGVLGEYLWRTLDAARRRTGFLVRERTGEPGLAQRARGSGPAAQEMGREAVPRRVRKDAKERARHEG